MIDEQKRTTLKTITAGAAYVAVPVSVHAATAIPATGTFNGYITEPVDPTRAKNNAQPLEIDIEATPERGTHWVRFSNVSDNPVTVKHVSPGLARSNGELIDVNAALNGDALMIMPNESYAFMVESVSSAAEAAQMPNARIAPFNVAIAGQDAPITGDVLTPRLVLS